jgi:phage shock protein C
LKKSANSAKLVNSIKEEQKMEKRLYKSSTDKILAGVCGGMGEYFDVDPVLIRVLWVISAFFGGAGVLAYIIAAIVIPSKEDSYKSRSYESTYRSTTSGASASTGSANKAASDSEGQTAEGSEAGDGEARSEQTYNSETKQYPRRSEHDNRLLGGIILIVLGGVFLFKELVPWMSGGLTAAALFIALGVFFLVRRNGDHK